jgi:hypothetical protein
LVRPDFTPSVVLKRTSTARHQAAETQDHAEIQSDARPSGSAEDPGRLAGRVKGLREAELEGVTVVLLGALGPGPWPLARHAEVDAQGRFRFDPVVPGRWRVQAQRANKGNLEKSVTIEAGAEAIVELEFFERYPVFGRALLGSEPVQRARVTFYPVETPWSRAIGVHTDHEGRFRIGSLPAGTYRVEIFWKGKLRLQRELRIEAASAALGFELQLTADPTFREAALLGALSQEAAFWVIWGTQRTFRGRTSSSGYTLSAYSGNLAETP